jgi:DICT domain-containing protein/signal transduction histidine kinase
MKTSISLLYELMQVLPHLRPHVYFKTSLTALSHAMEDLILVGKDKPLVIANFQHERFYLQESRRYYRIAQRTDQVYILAAPNTNFSPILTPYVTIPIDRNDGLAQEWHLIIIGQKYAACIIALEFASPVDAPTLDQARQFKGIWTFERQVSTTAAQLILQRILAYRPELTAKVEIAQQRYGLSNIGSTHKVGGGIMEIDARLFTDRLVTYLQSSQYKQLKAYRTITKKERQEHLINTITTAIRRSLNQEEIFHITVSELGKVFSPCRCLLYRYHPDKEPAPIEYEAVAEGLPSLKGEIWCLGKHRLFQVALAEDRVVSVADTTKDLGIRTDPDLSAQLARFMIRSCLLVSIRYQETWLGVLELHRGIEPYLWKDSELTLVEAIANQVGVAFIQAQAYSNLETFNRQLAALERTQSNLIAIVGHELRTPLSTIQVCLESLASEPDMPTEFRESMLETALTDSQRMRELIQDFLTLSRLEGGGTRWELEPISVETSVNLVLSSFKQNNSKPSIPEIVVELSPNLPLVHADGEGIIEVLTKLLDNACKFTPPNGTITISAQLQNLESDGVAVNKSQSKETLMLEIIIADTGRGIEPSQLEAIFERFYQEDSYLRRAVGGVGLGLAICRKVVENWGGAIWATSNGVGQGAEFHFTVPLYPYS